MPELAGRVADAFEASVRAHEEQWLSPLAVRSYDTRGRAREEEPCLLRTPFQRDRDRIVHCKPFRRLKGKTQVFIDPQGDHYRTRMTHTLETTAIARGVARALRLNEDLVEAIGLGHDMGHPPFGHAGEEALDHVLQERCDRRFRHNEESLRIAQGMNLTADMITKDPDLVGIFADNAQMGTGAGASIAEQKLGSKVCLVAFDSDAGEVEHLKDGSIYALIIQDPYMMGFGGVWYGYAAAHGARLPKNVDTGVGTVTKANMDDPKLAGLLDVNKRKLSPFVGQ